MHKIGFIVYPASEHGGPVNTSLGNEIQTSSFKRRTFDTLIVSARLSQDHRRGRLPGRTVSEIASGCGVRSSGRLDSRHKQ
jgi:hypothetical protein